MGAKRGGESLDKVLLNTSGSIAYEIAAEFRN